MLVLPHVSLLSLSQSARFLDAGFNFSNAQTLTINGRVEDLFNAVGVSGVWLNEDGILNIVKNNSNFEGIILNNVNFGSGRFQNLSFDVGNDVRIKNYIATVVINNTGNLFNFTGTYYTGINTDNWDALNNFSENYSFVKKENGGYSYTHNASIQFNSGLGNLNAIDSAKLLAKSLFTGSALGIAFYSGYTSKQGKRFYNESYNLIDNTCSFDESFDFDSDSGNYSITTTNSFELNENGIINVSENGIIRGIVRPTFESAAQAINGEIAQSFSRCNNVFSIYAPPGSNPLIAAPVNQNRSFDIFQNNLNYSITFSNDIDNLGTYFWDYTQQITYSNGIALLSENGTIVGRGANKQAAFNNAKNGFAVVKNSAPARATQFYTNNVGSPSANFLQDKRESYSPFQGQIEYTYNYSNEEVLVGTNGIKKIEIRNDENSPIYLYGKFAIFNEKEIIQDQKTATLGTRGLSLTLEGERAVPLSTYLDNAKTQINSRIPPYIDPYIIDTSYSFNPNNNVASVSLTWNFNRPAVKTIQV